MSKLSVASGCSGKNAGHVRINKRTCNNTKVLIIPIRGYKGNRLSGVNGELANDYGKVLRVSWCSQINIAQPISQQTHLRTAWPCLTLASQRLERASAAVQGIKTTLQAERELREASGSYWKLAGVTGIKLAGLTGSERVLREASGSYGKLAGVTREASASYGNTRVLREARVMGWLMERTVLSAPAAASRSLVEANVTSTSEANNGSRKLS
ncbi:hypothetical protein Bbelb_098660 [Branchiostoma belcheri]|nr:hypothetical protein Bbelb_098660 [Branchiostoma belcheri]